MIKEELGEYLIELARETVEKYLQDGVRPEPPEVGQDELYEKRGVFVTLKKEGKLRGCIGRPLPSQTLLEGLMESAISAAVGDPRFPSVDENELSDITFEVSVLTVPEEIEVDDPKEYVDEIEVGSHGLIAKGRGREGLLLPQVPVEQGWGEEEFISQTCVKAGLSPDSWMDKDVRIEKFSARVFKEESPGGDVGEDGFSK
ncbi:MAG: TIGR00296 family protein [Candidatus Hadarchaeia archaeon]